MPVDREVRDRAESAAGELDQAVQMLRDTFSAVAEARLLPRAAAAGGSGPELADLRSMAAQAGAHIEIQETPGGTRFAWHVPLDRPPSAAGR
jgi:hypothetical protein